jgi:hypothetical protein
MAQRGGAVGDATAAAAAAAAAASMLKFDLGGE